MGEWTSCCPRNFTTGCSDLKLSLAVAGFQGNTVLTADFINLPECINNNGCVCTVHVHEPLNNRVYMEEKCFYPNHLVLKSRYFKVPWLCLWRIRFSELVREWLRFKFGIDIHCILEDKPYIHSNIIVLKFYIVSYSYLYV